MWPMLVLSWQGVFCCRKPILNREITCFDNMFSFRQKMVWGREPRCQSIATVRVPNWFLSPCPFYWQIWVRQLWGTGINTASHTVKYFKSPKRKWWTGEGEVAGECGRNCRQTVWNACTVHFSREPRTYANCLNTDQQFAKIMNMLIAVYRQIATQTIHVFEHLYFRLVL